VSGAAGLCALAPWHGAGQWRAAAARRRSGRQASLPARPGARRPRRRRETTAPAAGQVPPDREPRPGGCAFLDSRTPHPRTTGAGGAGMSLARRTRGDVTAPAVARATPVMRACLRAWATAPDDVRGHHTGTRDNCHTSSTIAAGDGSWQDNRASTSWLGRTGTRGPGTGVGMSHRAARWFCRNVARGLLSTCDRSIAARAQHERLRALAVAYGVSRETIRAIVQRVRQPGSELVAMTD
jgi:hypothetical protein